MSNHFMKPVAAALALSLGLALSACGGQPTNRSLDSIKQPVVERQNFTLDVRTGGKYRLVFGDDPANPMAFFGKYLEVVPHKRIVWTNEESGDAGSVTTVTFEERDGKTLLVMSELYPTQEALDAAGTGAQEAMNETFGQLDDLLAELSAR